MELRVKNFWNFFFYKSSTQNINVDMRSNIFLPLTTPKIKKIKYFQCNFFLKKHALLCVITCSFSMNFVIKRNNV